MEEETNVNLDTTNEEVEIDLELSDDTPDVVEETPEIDVNQLQTTNKKLFERAKKAEAELKALRGTDKPQAPKVESSNVEELVLQATGMSDELLKELKAVAKVRGVSLIKAQQDPIFLAVKKEKEEEHKRQAASMPASRGAGPAKVSKDFNTPGLSREEHRKLLEEKGFL